MPILLLPHPLVPAPLAGALTLVLFITPMTVMATVSQTTRAMIRLGRQAPSCLTRDVLPTGPTPQKIRVPAFLAIANALLSGAPTLVLPTSTPIAGRARRNMFALTVRVKVSLKQAPAPILGPTLPPRTVQVFFLNNKADGHNSS